MMSFGISPGHAHFDTRTLSLMRWRLRVCVCILCGAYCAVHTVLCMQVIALRGDGATTVSATMLLAAAAGIRVFVTGGIGGVHRCALIH